MAYLTLAQLNSTVDLPVALPVTDLYPEEWLVISSTVITAPQTLSLRWLQGFILTSQDPSITGSDGSISVTPDANGQVVLPTLTPTLVTTGLGLAFIGLYRNFNSLINPVSQAAQELPLSIGSVSSQAPVSAARSLTEVIYTAPGSYSFVICNNTTNRLLRVVVNGQLRASLGPSPAS